MFRTLLTVVGLSCVAGAPLLADFSYQETSTITGGALAGMLKVAGVFSKQAREPIQTTVAVKGDRMVHRSQYHASVIDLASQTITSIDLQKKTYSVMTFDELQQALDRMSQNMKQNDKAQMDFKVSVKPTDNTKEIAGLKAKEMFVTMEMQGTDKESGKTGSMVITTDTWLAPGAPGYKAVRDFYRRMAEKINWAPAGNMFMSQPQAAKGMAEVYKEVAKLDGIPVQQFVTMGGAAQPGGTPPPAEVQTPAADKPSVGSALGNALGGRFGIRSKKTSSDQAPPSSSQSASGSGTLLEMMTTLSSFSSDPVDDSQFAVPSGFKKVEPDMKRGMR